MNNNLSQEIRDIVSSRPMAAGELIKQEVLADVDRHELDDMLASMLEAGELYLIKGGRYTLPERQGLFHAMFLASRGRYGFARRETDGAELFVPPRATGGAWHGDRVLVKARAGGRGENQEGEVVCVLSRATERVTGRLVRRDRFLYLLPDNPKLPEKIELITERGNRAAPGERVAAIVTDYGNGLTIPKATLDKSFGALSERDSAVEAILYANKIERNFSNEALDEARAFPATLDGAALAGRRDLRDELIFTIDGSDAKDLDDAVSLTRTADGGYLLGVHIADVSHYVGEGSALDEAGYARATSVYYADQVIPMLPVELSNGLCSLSAGTDKLALSAVMTLDADGKTAAYDLFPSVIRSSARMTYERANAMLDGADELTPEEAALLPALREMASLAALLKRRRDAGGSLDLESTEVKIVCDADGEPVDLINRRRGVTERVIEEFMLAANRTVAEHMHYTAAPMIFRVHESPHPERLREFAAVAARLGAVLHLGGDEVHPGELQQLLSGFEGKPEQAVLTRFMLRALAKAKYRSVLGRHFGLAVDYYCHFTSPIRRYPDLVVHRFLKRMLRGDAFSDNAYAFCTAAAANSSEREIAADTAARDIEKLYVAQYMVQFIGESFDGVVSGVQSFGFFVELSNGAEGLVPFATLAGGFEYDHEGMRLIRPHTGEVITLGQPVRVTCVASDPESGRIDFLYETENGDAASDAADGESAAE